MYTVEWIWINHNRLDFYETSKDCNITELNKFVNYILTRFNHLNGTDLINETKYFRLPNKAWQKIILVKGFKTQELAEKYFTEIGESANQFAHVNLKRAWQQNNKILAETNLLDSNGHVVKILSSCVGNICMRYGTCDDAGHNGCQIKPDIPNFPKGKFPIFHIATV